MPLGEFLFAYLYHRGVRHSFGVPGDFALSTFAWLEKSKIHSITMTHEPSAGFAAALSRGQRTGRLTIIDVNIPRGDISPQLATISREVAKRRGVNNGARGKSVPKPSSPVLTQRALGTGCTEEISDRDLTNHNRRCWFACHSSNW